ncbi:MAG: hypothetical protein WB630_20410, partial [Candidatus Acidiferrales bacterium]
KGQFQTDLMGFFVEVKNSARDPDKWAYYDFEPNANTAEAMPKPRPACKFRMCELAQPANRLVCR